jgi:hypothetical protein
MNDLTTQMKANKRQAEHFKRCQIPADFASLWQKMGLT